MEIKLFYFIYKMAISKKSKKTYYLTKKKNQENEYCSINKRHSQENQFKFSRLKHNFQEKKTQISKP